MKNKTKFKTFDDLKFKPHHSGKGLIARLNFENGYGVSVVRFKMPTDPLGYLLCGIVSAFKNGYVGEYGTYTNSEDEWELAVLKDNELTYNTPITNDVIGFLKPKEVTKIMKKVQQL